MIWILLTTLIGLAASLAAAPFLGASVAAQAGDPRRALFQRQINEVERDLSQGLISAPEAAALRIEAQRRLLAAGADKQHGETAVAPTRPWAAIIVAGIVVMAGAGLYALRGMPQATSAVPPVGALPNANEQMTVAGTGAGVDSVDAMVEGLKGRLEQNPGDADGWRMLGWSYFNMERFSEAADAYKRAVALLPQNAAYQSAYGEALVMAAAGFVTTDAKAAFDAAIKLDPAEPRARYFRGLALDQAGDVAGAINAWIEMVDTAPGDAEWAPDLQRRIEARAAEAGIDINGRLRSTDFVAAPRPSAEQVDAAMAMPAADRQAMIEGMVGRLAARLKDDPMDADGWIRLIRSRMVLGERASAQDDLKSALAAFKDDLAARDRIRREAESLGLRAP